MEVYANQVRRILNFLKVCSHVGIMFVCLVPIHWGSIFGTSHREFSCLKACAVVYVNRKCIICNGEEQEACLRFLTIQMAMVSNIHKMCKNISFLAVANWIPTGTFPLRSFIPHYWLLLYWEDATNKPLSNIKDVSVTSIFRAVMAGFRKSNWLLYSWSCFNLPTVKWITRVGLLEDTTVETVYHPASTPGSSLRKKGIITSARLLLGPKWYAILSQTTNSRTL